MLVDGEGKTQLIFMHHKTIQDTGLHVVTFPASTPLSKALIEYKKWGWRVLGKRGLTRFFMTPEKEGFKSEKAFTTYVNDKLKKQTGLQLSCRDYRTVAATELNGLVDDPEVREGLAMGMGTSINMWKKTYAPNYREIQVENGVRRATEQLSQQQGAFKTTLQCLQLENKRGEAGPHVPTRPKRRYCQEEEEEEEDRDGRDSACSSYATATGNSS